MKVDLRSGERALEVTCDPSLLDDEYVVVDCDGNELDPEPVDGQFHPAAVAVFVSEKMFRVMNQEKVDIPEQFLGTKQ